MAQAEWAAQCEDWDEWDKPAPPFRVHGNTWHVGTCGISMILITTSKAHVLIDSGTEAGAEVALANIRELGFAAGDIKMLLTSHEHFDHVGGMARMQEASLAPVLTSKLAVDVMRTGEHGEADPQGGMHPPMKPVSIVREVTPGARVRVFSLGDENSIDITAIATPGHTPGALSWHWESCDEAGDCLSIVYADSLSPVSADDYSFTDHPEYLQAYRDGLAKLAALDCDILLTPHPSASGMRDKLLAGDLTARPTCAEYADTITRRLDARLAEEAEGNP